MWSLLDIAYGHRTMYLDESESSQVSIQLYGSRLQTASTGVDISRNRNISF